MLYLGREGPASFLELALAQESSGTAKFHRHRRQLGTETERIEIIKALFNIWNAGYQRDVTMRSCPSRV